MRNVAITLKYLGTAYHGWQVQKTQVTVGETVEKAVAMVVGHPVHVTGCGPDGCGRPCARLYRQLPHDIAHPGGPPALCTQHTSAA